MKSNDDSVQVYLSAPSHDDPVHSLMTAREATRDIMLGSFAGMIAATMEYPLDLAKVRLQAQLLYHTNTTPLRFNGPWHCLIQTWKNEGVRGLYRGLPAPIVGAMAETATLFLSYSYFQNLIRSVSDTGKDLPLSLSQLGLAAGGAGFVASFILTPIELVKCRMQVQLMNLPIYTDPPSARNLSTSAAQVSNPTLIVPARPVPIADLQVLASARASSVAIVRKPEGPWSIIRSVVRSYGLRGLWLGHTGTMLRESGGSALWFSTKEWTASWLHNRRRQGDLDLKAPRKKKEGPSPWESALAGALAGGVSTLLLYPADTVKSAVQTEDEFRPRPLPAAPGKISGSSVRPNSAFMAVAKQMYVANGIKGFYAGCGMTVVRAVPGSAVIFAVYDGLSAWLA